MTISDDIERVKEARAYTVEHFGFTKESYVGHMRSNDFDQAVDRIVAFADKAYELLNDVVNTPSVGPGLSEDIAYTLGLIERWTCGDCGCVNGHHEAFCYRCGAGPDEEEPQPFAATKLGFEGGDSK